MAGHAIACLCRVQARPNVEAKPNVAVRWALGLFVVGLALAGFSDAGGGDPWRPTDGRRSIGGRIGSVVP